MISLWSVISKLECGLIFNTLKQIILISGSHYVFVHPKKKTNIIIVLNDLWSSVFNFNCGF